MRRLRPLLFVTMLGCARVDPATTTPPPTPVHADPSVKLETMDVECDAMVAALAAYKACPNLEDEDRQDLDGWIEIANRNLAASKKVSPEPNAQAAIAAACRKAAVSVGAAHERCKAGPKPKRD